MAIQNDLNIQKKIINGVVESNDWNPRVFEEKDNMLDLSNYTLYTTHYTHSGQTTIPAGTYLITPTKNGVSGFYIGEAVFNMECNEWIKIKLGTSVRVQHSNNYSSDPTIQFWRQN